MKCSRSLFAFGAAALGAALVAGCGAEGTGTGGPGTATGTGAATAAMPMTAAPPPKPVFKPEAKASGVTGDVKFVRAGATPTPPAPVTDGLEFQAGDTFTLADGASATFTLEDDGSAVVSGPAVVAMTNNERREWSVIAGKVDFTIKRTVGRDSFQVRTLNALLRAKGTPPPAGASHFVVAVAEDGHTWFAVKEGEVELIDENAELKMELDRAIESRTMPMPTTGAPGTPPPPPPASKIVAPTPLQTVAANSGVDVPPEGVAPAAAPVPSADGPAADWWTAHAAGKNLAKIVGAHAKAVEDLVLKAFDLVDKSEKLRASHKDLLEKAKAAREAKDEETARKIKTELVANTREARAEGRMAHQAVTYATLHWLAVDMLKAKAPGDAALEKATAKLVAGGELATKKADIEKKVDGLRKRPKFAVPTMPFAHGKLPPGVKGMAGAPTAVPGVMTVPPGTGAYSASPAPPPGAPPAPGAH
jgi:hypothetical protein